MSKSIRVCPFCSNVDIDKLKQLVGEENVNAGCVGACRKEKTQFFGRIDGVYVMTKTEKEFFDECQ